MSLNILYAGADARWDEYRPALEAAFADAGIETSLHRDLSAEAAVDYIVYAPNGPLQDFTPYTQTKAVLSLWAGVERIVGNKTLTQPLCRMVDAGLQEGMVEWVTAQVLRHHLGLDATIINPKARWAPEIPPLARNRRVAILGLGALGLACARALQALNFDVRGWSRQEKDIPGLICHHGPQGLKTALSEAEITVLLLPLTPQTENLIDARRLGWMPHGAMLINPGRGPLIDDDALIAALDSGQLGHATLDVFRVEPLPQEHPFWAHPKVTVTPHVAADTRPEGAAKVVAENIRRCENGLPLLHLVDRNAGY